MSAPTRPAPIPPPPVMERPGPPPRRWGSLGWGLGLVGAGLLWLLAVAGVDVRWEVVLPVALIVVGLLVLALGPRGGGGGLVGLGIVLAVLALALPAFPGPGTVSAGERTQVVVEPAELHDTHVLGAGSLTLDVRELDVAALDSGTVLTARVGVGELVVLVPAGVTVTGEGRVAIGEVAAFGRSRGGFAPSRSLTDPALATGPVLDLDLRVGLGRIEVTR